MPRKRHLDMLEPDERRRLAGARRAVQGAAAEEPLGERARARCSRHGAQAGPGRFGRNAAMAVARGRKRQGLSRPRRYPRRVALKRVIPCLDVDPAASSRARTSSACATRAIPSSSAARYDAEGADELVFLDITASHERRETIVDLARRTADDVFIPFTIGGGIRSVADAQAVLDAGRRQGLGQLGRARAARADRRAGRGLRLAVRRRRDRRPKRATATAALRRAAGLVRRRGMGRLRERWPRGRRGPGGGRLGARGGRARGGGDPADEHGPRRHQRRLRPRADPRGRRRGRGAGHRLGRRGRARPPGRRASWRATPTPCCAPRSSTTASTRSPRRRRRSRPPGCRSAA